MTIQTASALLFVALTACVADDARSDGEDSLDWRSGDGKQDGQTCEFDAMSAQTYYGQFDYKAVTYPSAGTWYRVGLTFNVQATLGNGDQADLDVYFLANDRVIVGYSELHRTSSGTQVINETIVVTRKRIDPTTRTITIDGVGSGTPVTVRGASGCLPGINFKYTGDLRSAGLTDKSTEIVAGLTTARVIDPDNLQDLPETMRRYFEEDVASGKLVVIRK